MDIRVQRYFDAFLSFETSTGYWLMISFGATSLVVVVLYDKEVVN